MQFSFKGGTRQQVIWAKQAIASCRYPMDGIDVPVTITWASTTPCGTAHTYMCTTDTGGSYTITIEDWADDANNPNNRGLPDPKKQIKDFYMQSLVHEIGHVALFELVTSNALRGHIAGLLWKADVNAGSGRRFGVLADYSLQQNHQLAWADEVVEALAEIIKVVYFNGPLIFLNRTHWRVDPQEWAELMTLILPQTGRGTGSYTADMIVPVTSGNLTVNNVFTDAPPMAGDHEGVMKVTGYVLSGTDDIAVRFGFQHSGNSGIDAGVVAGIHIGQLLFSPPFRVERYDSTVLATRPSIPPLPWWIRVVLRTDPSNPGATVEVWETDPVLGGSPLLSTNLSGFGSWWTLLASSQPFVEIIGNGVGSTFTVESIYWKPAGGKPSPVPPYPFAPGGQVKGGPAAIAQLRIGR